MSEELDWIPRAGAKAKGKRPEFLEPAEDRMLSILTALVGEVAVLRLRLDTVERLLEAGEFVTREAIEAWEPDREAGRERGLLLREYIHRVMRGVQQEVEALREEAPPVEQVIEQLKTS